MTKIAKVSASSRVTTRAKKPGTTITKRSKLSKARGSTGKEPFQLPPGTCNEHDKLRWWRLHVKGWTITKLANELGYTEYTVALYERGCNTQRKPFSARAWRRFKLQCAQLDGESPELFDWGITQ